jgi:hypothetical protein
MRYRPGALAVVGSNPTGPTELSVQILQNNKRSTSSTTAKTKNIKVESKVLTNTKSYEMRDLYHRRDKLAYWIQRVNVELEDPDKTDVLKLVEHMQDGESHIMDHEMHNSFTTNEEAARQTI